MLQKNRNNVANNQFTIITIWKVKGKTSLPLFISFLLLLFRIFRVLLLPAIVTGLHLLFKKDLKVLQGISRKLFRMGKVRDVKTPLV